MNKATNIIVSKKSIYLNTMAKDIAREIIAQSKGGSKMAFKISPEQSRDFNSSLVLSSSNRDQHVYHVYFIRDDKTYEMIYSGLNKACDFITSVLDNGWMRVQLVLYKEKGSKCIELSTAYASLLPSSLSLHIKDNLHLLDVIDVVEG